MPITAEHVGRSYPGGPPQVVSRSAIRDFALAIGEDDARCLDPEAARAAGFADVVAPPTFLVSLGSRDTGADPVLDPELGLSYARIVHTEQRFTLHRPVVAGDELSLTTTITQVRQLKGNDVVGIETEVRDAAGEPVAAWFMQILHSPEGMPS